MKNKYQSTNYFLPNRIVRFLFRKYAYCLEGCHLVMGHARSSLFIYFILFYFIYLCIYLSIIYLFFFLGGGFKNNQCILL